MCVCHQSPSPRLSGELHHLGLTVSSSPPCWPALPSLNPIHNQLAPYVYVILSKDYTEKKGMTGSEPSSPMPTSPGAATALICFSSTIDAFIIKTSSLFYTKQHSIHTVLHLFFLLNHNSSY